MPAGSTVTFTYVVINTGNVPLANVVVSDDKLGPVTSFTGDTNGNGLLDVTETWTYTTAAIALAGQQTNLGTVTGQDANNPPGTTVTDDDPANYFGDGDGRPSGSSSSSTARTPTARPGRVCRRQHGDVHLRGDQHRQRATGQRGGDR